MISGKFIFWLLFIASGAIAYPIVFLDFVWPMGRVIAGWYAIFVIVVVFGAGIFALSLKWRSNSASSEILDIFDI